MEFDLGALNLKLPRLAGIGKISVIVFNTIIVMAILGVIGYFIWKLLKYKYPVRLYIVGDNNKLAGTISDRAAIMKSGGIWYLKLLKDKGVLPVPNNDYFMARKALIFKTGVLHLIKYSQTGYLINKPALKNINKKEYEEKIKHFENLLRTTKKLDLLKRKKIIKNLDKAKDELKLIEDYGNYVPQKEPITDLGILRFRSVDLADQSWAATRMRLDKEKFTKREFFERVILPMMPYVIVFIIFFMIYLMWDKVTDGMRIAAEASVRAAEMSSCVIS